MRESLIGIGLRLDWIRALKKLSHFFDIFNHYRVIIMQKSLQILHAAQLALNALDAERAEENDDVLHPLNYRSSLLVADAGNGLQVQYDGEVWEDCMEIALTAIAQAGADIVSLKFAGPDEGANGSRTHEFDALLATNVTFTNLLELYIRPTDVSNHNIVDVAENQLPALIARCPNLESLTIPCAPEPEFFNIKLDNLRYLHIGMCWQLYDFINHLAKSDNFSNLTVFDFCDSLSVFQASLPKSAPAAPTKLATSAEFFKNLGYSDAQIKEMDLEIEEAFTEATTESRYDDSYTSFAAYEALFKSTALKEGAVFHLRNAYLTAEQCQKLQQLRPDLQFSLSLEAPHVYVSHWQGKFASAYKHLIIPR